MKEIVGKINKSNEFVVRNAIYFIVGNYLLIIGAFSFGVWQRWDLKKNQDVIKNGVYHQISTEEQKQKTDSLANIKKEAEELKMMIPNK